MLLYLMKNHVASVARSSLSAVIALIVVSPLGQCTSKAKGASHVRGSGLGQDSGGMSLSTDMAVKQLQHSSGRGGRASLC